MARRNHPPQRRRGGRSVDRPFSIGSHWRADGAPKAAFRSQLDAAGAADELRFDSGARLDPYQCDFCGSWHLGSAAGRDHDA